MNLYSYIPVFCTCTSFIFFIALMRMFKPLKYDKIIYILSFIGSIYVCSDMMFFHMAADYPTLRSADMVALIIFCGFTTGNFVRIKLLGHDELWSDKAINLSDEDF